MPKVSLYNLPPQVGVLLVREQLGANNLSDDCYGLKCLKLEEALTECWDTDAHFVTYALMDPVTGKPEAYPRCNKPILGKLRKQGLDLLHKCLVMDVDTEDHTPWDNAWLQGVLDNIRDAEEQASAAGQWSDWYTTTNGLRIIYRLDRWITPEQYEAKHRWLSRELTRYNIPADLEVSDWTRIFRLPFVVRDKKPTWESDSLRIEQRDRVVGPDTIKEIDNGKQYSLDAFDHVEPVSRAMPKYNDCFDLLFDTGKDGGRVQSKLYKQFYAQIKNREAFDALKSHEPFAREGSRDSTLHKLLGQCIGMGWRLKGFSPEFLLGVWWEKLDELAPDRQTPSWHQAAWDHICRIWAKEQAQQAFVQAEEAQAEAETEEMILQMLNGMREWCSAEDAPDLHADDSIALAYLSRHLICSLSGSYQFLGPDGRYGEGHYGSEQIIPLIRNSHLDGIISTKALGAGGSMNDRSVTSILNDHSFPVQEAQAIVSNEGGTIKGIDTDRSILNVPLYRLNPDLKPEYNPLVDRWLQEMFGDHFEKACYWIGWALDFASGATVAALSLVGAPGAGKKMFTQGLAECLQRPAMATHEDLTSGHGYGLMRSPFLVINEGWPQSINRGQAPSDQMKAMIGGDPLTVARKFLPPVTLKCPTRIIMTANDFEVVSMLGKGKDLTRETTEALAVRLFNVQLSRNASEWLRGIGGFDTTKGWIEGDAGEKSEYTVARHFLWLHENRGSRNNPLISPQRRLVVEGNMDDEELSFMLRTQSGSAPLVIETLVMMLEGRGSKGYGFVVHEPEGRSYILASAVLNYYRLHLQEQAKEILTEKQIASVLTNLSINEKNHAYVLSGAESMGRRHWHELDLYMLDRACERSGMKNKKIKELLAVQARGGNGGVNGLLSKKEQQKRLANITGDAIIPKIQLKLREATDGTETDEEDSRDRTPRPVPRAANPGNDRG